MTSRRLGATGLEISPVGLGLAALGRPGYVNLGHRDDLPAGYDVDAMRRHAHAVLDAAWAGGVRYFDAARSYGRAEEFLASWLGARRLEPGAVTVGSKWGYTYTAGWRADAERHEVKDHSVATLRRQLAETRRHLGPHLRLYQIHSATLDTGVLDDAGVCGALGRLRDSGVAVGLSLSGPGQAATLHRALDVRHAGGPLFSCVQATWNLLERSAGEALRAAADAGLGVIVKEALANGRLTTRNDEPGFRSRRAALDRVAARHRTSIDAVAIAAALAQPWADVVLSGAATVEQLRSNLAANAVAYDGPDDDALAGLVEDPGMYWSVRARLPWN